MVQEYGERLKKLGCTNLEMKRKRGDLIQLYKIANGLEEVDLGIKIGEKIMVDHTHTRFLGKTVSHAI